MKKNFQSEKCREEGDTEMYEYDGEDEELLNENGDKN